MADAGQQQDSSCDVCLYNFRSQGPSLICGENVRKNVCFFFGGGGGGEHADRGKDRKTWNPRKISATE